MAYNIGPVPVDDIKYPCGIGYVAFPSDVDRDDFISNCFLKGTISFKTKDGGFYHNCPIDKSKFNDIIWPTRWQDNGSPIVYITEPIQQVPIVIGIVAFNDEIIDQKENQFKIKRIYNKSIIEISGSADDECLTLFVNGVQRSDLFIRLTHDANAASMQIDIDGEYQLLTIGDVFIKSQTQIIQKVGIEDDKTTTFTQNNSEFNFRTNRLSINDGKEPITLGNKMKKLMDDLIDELSKTTVTTALGQMPILNAAQVKAFKDRTEEILSEISFTD